MSPDSLVDALLEEFPWLGLLPTGSRSEFAIDFVHAFRVSAELGYWSPLNRMVHEWKATAVVYADPTRAAELTGPVEGDHGPVSQ